MKTTKISKWKCGVLDLLKKLPQYNETDFPFDIEQKKPANLEDLHYFVKNGIYRKTFYERGKCYEYKRTLNLKKAMYWVLYDVTFEYVINFEKNHRVNRYIDSRRQWMKLWQEMFDIFGPPYNEKIRRHIAATLRRSPFDDSNTCQLFLVKDYEEIAKLLKETSFYRTSTLCQNNVDRLLTAYRDKHGGIPNFEKAFISMQNETAEIYSFLLKEQDKSDITEILKRIEYTKNMAQKYINK